MMAPQVVFDKKQLKKAKKPQQKEKKNSELAKTVQQDASEKQQLMQQIKTHIPKKKREEMKQEAEKEAYKDSLKEQAKEKLKDPKQEAKKQAASDVLKDEEKSDQKLDELVKKSQRILFTAKNVFPFDFFPDEITIDENKINIAKKSFFGTGRIHSIYIKDVADVFIESSPFFSTLKIVDSGFVENTVDVNYLKNSDAHRARRIIQGLVVATKEGVDLSGLQGDDIAKKIEELGKESESNI